MMQYDSEKHFSRLFAGCRGKYSFAANRAPVAEWQGGFRSELRGILGLTAMEEDLPDYAPTAERAGVEDMGSYTRERWILHTEPTVPLPVYLLRPKALRGKLPLVLTPHGHGHPHIYVGNRQIAGLEQ